MTTSRNHEQQRQLYGASLQELAGQVMDAFGLTQRKLAETLGLSTPMLSQLLSAQRIKIGNPAVVHRLQELLALVPRAAQMTPAEQARALRGVQALQTTLTRPSSGEADMQAGLRALREVATSYELLAAAAQLTEFPALAHLLTTAAGGRP